MDVNAGDLGLLAGQVIMDGGHLHRLAGQFGVHGAEFGGAHHQVAHRERPGPVG
jgi:hypothetical protein